MRNTNNPYILLKSEYPRFLKSEKKIADYVLANSEKIPAVTIAVLSKKIGVAESSIVRFCKSIGFEGFTDFKISLATYADTSNKESGFICSDISKNDKIENVFQKAFENSITGLQDTLAVFDLKKAEKAVDLIFKAEKVYFIAVGFSAPIADDATNRYMRIGIPAVSYTDPHIASVACSLADEKTVIIAISHAGRTPEVINPIKLAKENGATVISITSYSKSPLEDLSDIVLEICSAEATLLNEAITSRIAHISVLDALYTGICVKYYDETTMYLNNFNTLMEQVRF